jgi:hypothetical protein
LHGIGMVDMALMVSSYRLWHVCSS